MLACKNSCGFKFAHTGNGSNATPGARTTHRNRTKSLSFFQSTRTNHCKHLQQLVAAMASEMRAQPIGSAENGLCARNSTPRSSRGVDYQSPALGLVPPSETERRTFDFQHADHRERLR